MTRKIHDNELHAKISPHREDRMRVTVNHLQYRVKGVVEVCEDYSTEKSKHKFLHKVTEERNLKPVEMIYLDLISEKKPSYGGSNN